MKKAKQLSLEDSIFYYKNGDNGISIFSISSIIEKDKEVFIESRSKLYKIPFSTDKTLKSSSEYYDQDLDIHFCTDQDKLTAKFLEHIEDRISVLKTDIDKLEKIKTLHTTIS